MKPNIRNQKYQMFQNNESEIIDCCLLDVQWKIFQSYRGQEQIDNKHIKDLRGKTQITSL